MAEVMTEIANRGTQIVLKSATGYPLGEAVEVPVISEYRVGGHASLGPKIIAECADIVG
jgi:hypothetical protein